jgi:hypothetical protein
MKIVSTALTRRIASAWVLALALATLPAVAAKAPAGACAGCHADWSSVLPKGHPVAKGTTLGACTSCHVPDFAAGTRKGGYSTRLHRAHVGAPAALECSACHAIVAGRSFGLVGVKGSWGAPKKDELALLDEVMRSWAGSGTTGALHAKAGIACAPCHGKGLPKPDDTVANDRCLACHGPADALVQRSEPKDFKDRNPHRSHLGDIACTVCHKGHAPSMVYCLDCHRKFTMAIPGAAKP